MLRNLWHVVLHFKAAFILNLLGLAVAFTAFMMIMMQVRYDLDFDRCYDDADCIVRVDAVAGGNAQAIITRPLARMLAESSPKVEAACITQASTYTNFWQIESGGVRQGYNLEYWDVSPEITEVFGFDMTEGGMDALETPGSVIIPESLATRIFSGESAVGHILPATSEYDIDRTITGVYRDFPKNASMKNVVYTSMNPQENYDNWGNWNYYCFLKLDDPASADGILEDFKKNNAEYLFDTTDWDDSQLQLIFDPLPELHFRSAGLFDGLPKASRSTVNALIAIAFIILLIAGINFTNFSTALTPMRIKGVNTRKVLGSSDAAIRGSLVGEIVLISVAAFLLSVVLLHLAGMTPLSRLVDCDISLKLNAGIILACSGAAVILGVLSGLYPAFYMTSLPPALVLKGSFGLSAAGRRLRSVLMGVQFTASFALLIAASFIWLQNRYMLRAPLGFDKDQVIVTDINENIRKNEEAFKAELKKFAGIENVALSQFTLSSGDFYMTWGRDLRGESITFACLPVDHEFLDALGIKVSDGRNFRADDETREIGAYIFNETARRQFDIKLGEEIDGDEIIGFIPDINFASMRQSITPMAFFMFGKNHWGGVYQSASIRVEAGSDLRAARQAVEDCLRSFDPEYPFNVRFYDSILEDTYQKEQRTGSLITLFSLVAIFISIVGVFSLVVFDCEYRRKEIAVRKVLGSSEAEVTGMFCRSYMVMLAVCFVIGAPLAWLAVDRWLESFAYRTPLHWWVFPAAFAAIAAVTLLTVIGQSWRAANENPVKNLKSE